MKHAAVAAALAGAALAEPLTTVSVNWDSWSTTTTTWDPKATTWTTWDPKAASTTWTSWDPKQTTWTTWDPKATTWTSWDPKPTTWTTWDPKASTWTTWDPSWSTSTSTWGTWSSWATPVVDTKTQTWSNWNTWATPVVNTKTQTWNTWATPVVVTKTQTWNTWATPAAVTKTTGWATWGTPAVVTSVVTPAWSSNGWFGPAWGTATGSQCLNNVVTSYGVPSWSPVPVVATATGTWSTWASPAVATKTATWSAYGGVSTGYAPIKPNGNKWSMTYSVYDSSSNCKTQEVIIADIAIIAGLGFTSVRVYSTDCHTLEWVGAACRQYGLTIILGVYIDSTGVSATTQQINDIVAWAQWDIVALIVIGNEAVFNGYCSAEELVTLVSSSKATFAAAGYNGPCTITEPLAQWQAYGSDQFCEVVDVVAANLYAFFNADCPAENAGTFIASEIEILTEICVSKPSYVMECGWPSAGQCNGQACPGVQEQITAITAIEEIVGSQIVWFSYENEMWKAAGEFGVEQYWGAASVFQSSWSPAPAPASKTTTWASWGTPAATTTWSTWATPDPTKWT